MSFPLLWPQPPPILDMGDNGTEQLLVLVVHIEDVLIWDPLTNADMYWILKNTLLTEVAEMLSSFGL